MQNGTGGVERWEFRGENHTITEWAEIMGLKRRVLYQRVHVYGWTIDESLSKVYDTRIRHMNAPDSGPTPTYRSWQHMRDRCLNRNSDGYRYYGARGISVCTRWNEFKAFLADMGERPPGTTLERINNAKNYSPNNCRWATRKEQLNNTRYNRILEFDGQSHNIAEWAAIVGIPHLTLRSRLNYGWSTERALTEPVTVGRQWKGSPRSSKRLFTK